MTGGRWVTYVGPCRVVAVLVLKDAVEHDELFASRVGVCRKPASGLVADDGGVAAAPEHY